MVLMLREYLCFKVWNAHLGARNQFTARKDSDSVSVCPHTFDCAVYSVWCVQSAPTALGAAGHMIRAVSAIIFWFPQMCHLSAQLRSSTGRPTRPDCWGQNGVRQRHGVLDVTALMLLLLLLLLLPRAGTRSRRSQAVNYSRRAMRKWHHHPPRVHHSSLMYCNVK